MFNGFIAEAKGNTIEYDFVHEHTSTGVKCY